MRPPLSSSPLLLRQRALQATVDRFTGQAFAWFEADCWTMVRAHLRALGQRPPRTPRYQTAIGAKRALARAGFDSLADAIDSMLPRIAPAQMLPGDIGAWKGTEGLHALVIGAGHKVFGWHEDAEGPVFIIPHEPVEIAWRAHR